MQREKIATTAGLEQGSTRSVLWYRVLLRVVSLVHHIAATVALVNLNLKQYKIPKLVTFSTYKLRYLTNWNFAMQFLYFILALLCDFLEWMQWNSGTAARKLETLRAFYFSSIVFPNTLLVASLFWSIYLIDRDWIFPKSLDAFVPAWINHSFHTVILGVALLDMVLQPGERPVNDSKNKTVLHSVCLLYQLVLFCTYLQIGYWIYPFYNNFNIIQYFIFSCFLFDVYAVCYEVQWLLVRLMRKFRSIKTQ